VVDETRKEGNEDVKGRIPWALHRDSHHAEIMDEDRMAKVNKVLANLARQTSLTLTIERHPVDIWFVFEVEDKSSTALNISRSAIQQAKEERVEVLPFPVLGLPYDFTLTSIEGRVIDSKAFRAKVLLIDCWATWCWSCLKKMQKMKEFYSKWHPQNLEIIGVNLDLDKSSMTKAVKSLSLPWPQIMVPGEPSVRELWHKATGISAIPRCLIVDRQGILRADCSPKELEQELTRIIRLETPQ
jgi:thiol-disulfide isomerase/thioredoxin